jgi:adenosylhomocysteine nucleosidase
MNRIAIVSAMHEELRALLPLLEGSTRETLAGREFHQGRIHGHSVVLVLSGIGKVAAATTAALLMQRFDVDGLLFTGVAGGLAEGVQVGDVVVASELIQHDMDASPLFPRFEIPLTGRSRFDADVSLADALAAAGERCLQQAGDLMANSNLSTPASLRRVDPTRPRLHRGLVASGDRFVSSHAESAALRAALPDALAVEMEGAALAQVCGYFERPFAVLRTISDRADDSAHVDFTRFIHEVASVYTRLIVADWLANVARS